jgi:hypothetical protein
MHTADSDVEKYADNIRKRMTPLMTIAIQTGDTAKVEAINADIDAKIEAERNRVYQSRGIDPLKIQNLGKQDTPHTPKSTDEFNATVKPGQWFINPKDGKKYKRTSAAPPAADEPDGILNRTAAALPAAAAEAAPSYTSASVASYGGEPEE